MENWGFLVFLCFFAFLIIYSLLRKHERIQNAAYVRGTSLGIKRGVRGTYNLYYAFTINKTKYVGSYPTKVCKSCDCCDSGKSVIVRIENGKPENNDVVSKLPEGAWFLDY